MVWNSDKIKNLRLRMGWSQSDLARHLACDPDQVRFLEGSLLAVKSSNLQDQLELLEKMADSQAQTVLQGALAEMVMDENHADQIPQDLVRKRFLT
jgi:ribosome-binding protein aMBF1 (putative translation factor)